MGREYAKVEGGASRDLADVKGLLRSRPESSFGERVGPVARSGVAVLCLRLPRTRIPVAHPDAFKSSCEKRAFVERSERTKLDAKRKDSKKSDEDGDEEIG